MADHSPKTFGQLVSFTPVLDELVKSHGPMVALVFGRVWRYCQAEDQECWASHARMGRDLGLSPKTVMRKLDELVESGYLFKEYRSGVPSIYTIRPESLHELPVTESHRTTDRKSQVPRTESHTKIQKKKGQDRPIDGKPSRQISASVNVFRKNAHRYPAKSWWKTLEQEIGESEKDLKFWGEVVFSWVGLGWNPTNVMGMLDYYRRRALPGKKSQKEPAGFKAIRLHVMEKADG